MISYFFCPCYRFRQVATTRLLLVTKVYGSSRLTGEAREGARTRGRLQVAERTLVYEDRD